MDGVTEHGRHPQVNRIFRDAILTSPLTRHKIELFAAGLEHNAAAGIGLAGSQKAFLQYRATLDSLRPAEERTVDGLQPWHQEHAQSVGGVYAIMKDDAVCLLTLGSASRGIPFKEWEIPLPTEDPAGYAFYPNADVIAFVKLQEVVFVYR